MANFKAFIQRKELGLPIWAWAMIVSVLVLLLYLRFKRSAGNSSPAATADTLPPDATGSASQDFPPLDSGAGTDTGTGGVTDDSQELQAIADEISAANANEMDALSQLQATPLDLSGLQPATDTAPAPTAPSHPPLRWDSTDFTTRAQFNAYLKAKGLSVAGFAMRHPAAYNQYLELPAGKPVGKPKSGTKTIPKKKTAPKKSSARVVAPIPLVHVTPALRQARETAGRGPVLQTLAMRQPAAKHATVASAPAPTRTLASVNKPTPAPVQAAPREVPVVATPALTKARERAGRGPQIQ